MTNAETLSVDFEWLPWSALTGTHGEVLDQLLPLHQRELTSEQRQGLEVLTQLVLLHEPLEMKGTRVGFLPESAFEALDPSVLRMLIGRIPAEASDWLRSRVLHVAWERRRSCSHLQVAEAVDAYLRHADAALFLSESIASSHAIELAARLGASLGRDSLAHTRAISHALAHVLRLDGSDTSYFSARIFELLLEFGCESPAKMANLAERTAHAGA